MFSFLKPRNKDEAAQGELRRLSGLFKEGAAASPPEMLASDGRTAVWSIPLNDGGRAFVSASRYPYLNDEIYVVEVDADRFYYHWLKSTLERGGECVPVQEMPGDRKYRQAEEGFAEGRKNPVPLAEVNAYETGGMDYVGFTNGVTRSFWLLAHGAKSFPVETHGIESARKLHELAGTGQGPRTLDELFPLPDGQT